MIPIPLKEFIPILYLGNPFGPRSFEGELLSCKPQSHFNNHQKAIYKNNIKAWFEQGGKGFNSPERRRRWMNLDNSWETLQRGGARHNPIKSTGKGWSSLPSLEIHPASAPRCQGRLWLSREVPKEPKHLSGSHPALWGFPPHCCCNVYRKRGWELEIYSAFSYNFLKDGFSKSCVSLKLGLPKVGFPKIWVSQIWVSQKTSFLKVGFPKSWVSQIFGFPKRWVS